MGNLETNGSSQIGDEPKQEYLTETLEVLQRLGDERVARLDKTLTAQRALGIDRVSDPGYIVPEGEVSSAALIDAAVVKYNETVRRVSGHHGYVGDEPDLAMVGYSTVADAIEESAQSRRGRDKWLLGKLGITGVVKAHRARYEILSVELSRAASMHAIREMGIAGTPTIHVDEETGLHLVELNTVEHLVYEGVMLRHCLSDKTKAKVYLAENKALYSLREDGTLPKVTLQVDAGNGVIVQARGDRDSALVQYSPEHEALLRSLSPLGAHLAAEAGTEHRTLLIADKIVPPNWLWNGME